MPSSSGCGRHRVERVPAHMRDLQRRIGRRDAVDLAGDPAETRRSPRIRGRARPSAACRRRCRRTAGRCSRTLSFERLDHAGDGIEAAPAIGEGADARQHDAVGARAPHRDRCVTMIGWLVSAARARRARTPSPPNADCRSRNRRSRRSPRRSRLAGTGRSRRMATAAGARTGAAISASARSSARSAPAIWPRACVQASKKRRSAASRSSPTTMPSVVQPRRDSVQRRRRRRLEADQQREQHADQRPSPLADAPQQSAARR